MDHATKEYYEQINDLRYELLHVTAERDALKDGLDTALSLLAGKTDEEVKMCYDYLYDLRYPNG